MLASADNMSVEVCVNVMSRGTAFTTTWHVRPAKTQISLRIRAVWSESSHGAVWVANNPKNLQADSED